MSVEVPNPVGLDESLIRDGNLESSMGRFLICTDILKKAAGVYIELIIVAQFVRRFYPAVECDGLIGFLPIDQQL